MLHSLFNPTDKIHYNIIGFSQLCFEYYAIDQCSKIKSILEIMLLKSQLCSRAKIWNFKVGLWIEKVVKQGNS